MIAAAIAFAIVIASGPLGYQAASAIRAHLAASAPCLAEVYSPQAARLHLHVRTSWAPVAAQAYSHSVQAYSDGSYHVEAVALLDGRPVARAASSGISTTLLVNLGFLSLRLPLGRPEQAADAAARDLAVQLRQQLCSAPVPEQDQGPAS